MGNVLDVRRADHGVSRGLFRFKLRPIDLVGRRGQKRLGVQDLFITYGGMGDGGGVALFTNAVPKPTTVLIWSILAGLGMTVRRRR